MKKEVIGDKEYFYSTPKELFYNITKDYYLKETKLFKRVRAFTETDFKNSIFVPIIKKYNGTYFKMDEKVYSAWREIITKLKEKYGTNEVKTPLKPINNELDVEEIKKKINKMKPTTILRILLDYAPVNENGVSEIFYFENIDKTNKKHLKLIPNNGVQWDRTVCQYFNIEKFKEKGSTIAFRFNGYNLNPININKTISPKIRSVFKDKPCVHCYTPNKSHKPHEIDHKNGRYNDLLVLHNKTQIVDDFQPLCKEHNVLKRTSCVRCKETNVRFDATFLGYPVSVVSGSLKYTPEIGCEGCYWFDPIVFRSKLSLKD